MGRPRKKPAAGVPPPPPPPVPTDVAAAASADSESDDAFRQPQRSACRIKRVQRTRSGCASCKQRRKKCDEAQPICGDCSRLGLVCQWVAPSPPPHCHTPSSSSSFAVAAPVGCQIYRASSSGLQLTPLALYDGSTSREQLLLQHYALVVSRSLSVVPDEINEFLTLFVPMAVQQPAMRSALLALSATHLKRVHAGFEVTAVEYQNRALKQANQLLMRGAADAAAAEEGLAAVLFLCLQDVCEGRSRKWPLHLDAAVTIINARGGPQSYPHSIRFLIETVAYFDAIATLSFSKPANLDQQFYQPAAAATALPAHALFGTAHALFAAIADISRLAQAAPLRHASAQSEATFGSVAAALELRLQRWTPAPCSSLTSDPHLEAKITAAGVMLQWAALMRLHLVVAAAPVDCAHPKVRAAVANILAALDVIPQGDLVESMLIFPVFAAGVGAATATERARVDRRFAVMEKSIGFGNVFDAHDAVRAHWARMDAGAYAGRNVSWEEVVANAGGSLIMS